MEHINQKVNDELLRLGADIVGFGDLRELQAEDRNDLPFGVSVAVLYPPDVIRGIADLPTKEYSEFYDRINDKLDMIVTAGAIILQEMGYNAVAQTREHVKENMRGKVSKLPHKTVATRAGLGWIGKSALFVTDEYGSALRISSILTDAPLSTAVPVNDSRCGNCVICADACPGSAVSGMEWNTALYRDEFFDASKCYKTAKERTKLGCGGMYTLCGKCIEVCPYTRKYTKE